MQGFDSKSLALGVAWAVALTATLGALFVGEVMGKVPCVLCWYQRIAMFPLPLILGLAAYFSDFSVRRYVLPIASVGAAIALWHSLVFAGIAPEGLQPCRQEATSCAGSDQVVLGFLPLPYLSFASFTAIVLLLLIPFARRLE